MKRKKNKDGELNRFPPACIVMALLLLVVVGVVVLSSSSSFSSTSGYRSSFGLCVCIGPFIGHIYFDLKLVSIGQGVEIRAISCYCRSYFH